MMMSGDNHALSERLARCHTSVVHDVMKDFGIPIRVLPRTIVGLASSMRMAGPAFTIRGRPDATLDKHTSLAEWAALLSKTPPGCVAIVQAQDDTRALFGGLSAEALLKKGVRGYIVDGGCRDIDAIIDLGFPVFARFATPIDIVGAWRAEAFGEPIAIGGHMITAEDFILADRDGVILIPRARLDDVLSAAETKMNTEGDMVRAIKAGEDPLQAYLKYRVF
jgi:4-hydroxy-4-methyl-2-oxoglutarate aldolase